MLLQSLLKLNNSISVQNLGILPPNSGADKTKIGLCHKLVSFQLGILKFGSQVQGKTKKKVFATFWFYLSPEFQIVCCQVGITHLLKN